MYTTASYHSGPVKEEDKYLTTYKFKDGYVVEDKGLYLAFPTNDQLKMRFEADLTLLRLDILGIDASKKAVRREEILNSNR